MGYILAILSAVTIAGSSLSAKRALKHEHSLGFALIGHIMGLTLLLPFAWMVDFVQPLRMFGWMYLASLFGCFAFLFTTKAMRKLQVSVVVPLLNLSVIFLIFFSYFLLDEVLSPLKLFGVLLIVCGGYLLDANHGGIHLFRPFQEFMKSRYFHFLAGGIFFYACSSVVDKIVIRHVQPFTYLFFIYVFLTMNYLIWFILRKPEGGFVQAFGEAEAQKKWVSGFVVGRLLSNLFYVFALQTVFVAVAIAIKRTSALLTVMASGRMFHEKHIAWKLGVSSVMLVGVVLAIIG